MSGETWKYVCRSLATSQPDTSKLGRYFYPTDTFESRLYLRVGAGAVPETVAVGVLCAGVLPVVVTPKVVSHLVRVRQVVEAIRSRDGMVPGSTPASSSGGKT